MTATAAFSHRPWLEGIPYDPVEDFLHSLTATMMGFAFAIGVMVRLIQRRQSHERGVVFDLVAVAAATIIPLLMVSYPSIDGILQRCMFLIAYLWYSNEARTL